MFPQFFQFKAKEVISFLQILKGKITGDDEMRKQGVVEALKSMEEERQVYLQEKDEAEKNMDSDIPGRKPVNNSNLDAGRDISAI